MLDSNFVDINSVTDPTYKSKQSNELNFVTKNIMGSTFGEKPNKLNIKGEVIL